MIDRYNHSQTLHALVALVGGLICFSLAFLFFRYVPAFIAWNFHWNLQQGTSYGIAAFGLAAIAFSGYRTWKAGGGLQGYHESALYHDLGGDTAGAVVVDHLARRVTGPAHVLSQIFLAGPLLLLRCRTLLASRLPRTEGLEERLARTLETLRMANRWQSISEYPGMRNEVLYLAQMRLIDFSSHKGTPRIKAERVPAHGTESLPSQA